MTKRKNAGTTKIGYVNKNGLKVTEKTNRRGTHPNQWTYVLYHLHERNGVPPCNQRTEANGCDIWDTVCAHCRGGGQKR